MTPAPGALRAHAVVVAERGPDGRTRLCELRSSPPLALRQAGGAVWMVGTAAGPLAGDHLRLRVAVGPGASLTLRSTAASVVLGGPGEHVSVVSVDATVAEGGTLRWLPEPTVATGGCRHRASASISVAGGASVVWRDELVLGRHGEAPGCTSSRIAVDLEGRCVARHALRVGPEAPGWDGPAVLGDAGAAGTVVVVDPALAPQTSSLGPDAAVLALAGGGAVVSAVAPDAFELRRRLDQGLAALARQRLEDPGPGARRGQAGDEPAGRSCWRFSGHWTSVSDAG